MPLLRRLGREYGVCASINLEVGLFTHIGRGRGIIARSAVDKASSKASQAGLKSWTGRRRNANKSELFETSRIIALSSTPFFLFFSYAISPR